MRAGACRQTAVAAISPAQHNEAVIRSSLKPLVTSFNMVGHTVCQVQCTGMVNWCWTRDELFALIGCNNLLTACSGSLPWQREAFSLCVSVTHFNHLYICLPLHSHVYSFTSIIQQNWTYKKRARTGAFICKAPARHSKVLYIDIKDFHLSRLSMIVTRTGLGNVSSCETTKKTTDRKTFSISTSAWTTIYNTICKKKKKEKEKERHKINSIVQYSDTLYQIT